MNTSLIFFQRVYSYSLALLFYKQRIAEFFDINPGEVDEIYKELDSSSFTKEISKRAGIRNNFLNLSMSSVLRAPAFYAICRILKPEIIVETGVADGFSSAYILFALQENAKGKLYSIDLPNQPGQVLSEGRSTGWLVDAGLRSRWNLIIGLSKEKLPPLLKDLKEIDIFYHDSDHSYENMMFEFTVSKKFISPSGIIISDDVTDNKSFYDFCRVNSYRTITLFKTGVARRSPDNIKENI